MEDSSRFRLAQPSAPTEPRPEARPPAPKRDENPAFVGNAMKALFETAEVSIRRGDETRVITKGDEDKHAQPRGAAQQSDLPEELPPGLKPAPHVDLVLWLVLAAGLFGIAGWMLAHGL